MKNNLIVFILMIVAASSLAAQDTPPPTFTSNIDNESDRKNISIYTEIVFTGTEEFRRSNNEAAFNNTSIKEIITLIDTDAPANNNEISFDAKVEDETITITPTAGYLAWGSNYEITINDESLTVRAIFAASGTPFTSRSLKFNTADQDLPSLSQVLFSNDKAGVDNTTDSKPADNSITNLNPYINHIRFSFKGDKGVKKNLELDVNGEETDTRLDNVSIAYRAANSTGAFSPIGEELYSFVHDNDNDLNTDDNYGEIVIVIDQGHLNYGTEYEITLTQIKSNEKALNVTTEIKYTFTIEPYVAPEVILANTTYKLDDDTEGTVSDGSNWKLSPYTDNITIEFDKGIRAKSGGSNRTRLIIQSYNAGNWSDANLLEGTPSISSGNKITFNLKDEEFNLPVNFSYEGTYRLRLRNLYSSDQTIINRETYDIPFSLADKDIPVYDPINSSPAHNSPSFDPTTELVQVRYDQNIKTIDGKTTVTLENENQLYSSTETPADPAFTFRTSGQDLIIDLADNTYFNYGTTYTFSIENVASNEDIEVLSEAKDQYSFTTNAKSPPEYIANSIEFVQDGTDPANGDGTVGNISPYLYQFKLNFDKNIKVEEGAMPDVKLQKLNNNTYEDTSIKLTPSVDTEDPTTLVLALDNGVNLDYGGKYQLVVDELYAAGVIPNNMDTSVEIPFEIKPAVKPSIKSVNGKTEPLSEISIYNQKLEFEFDPNGIMDNGSDDDVTIVGEDHANVDFSRRIISGKLEITFTSPLHFDETYTVTMTQFKSNEDVTNVVDKLEYTFTTTKTQPSISNIENAYQTICVNKPSENISWYINEGHQGNFHDNTNNEYDESIIFGIRNKDTGAIASDLRFDSRGNVNGTGDVTNPLIDNANPDGDESDYFMRVKFDPANVKNLSSDVLQVTNVRLMYSNTQSTGTYEIYVAKRSLPFSGPEDEDGIQVGDVVATIILQGDDAIPNLIMSESRSGDENVCNNEQITFSVDNGPDDATYYYFVDNVQQGDARTTFSTSSLVSRNKVKAQTISTCPSTSNTIPIEVIDIDPDDITFTVTIPQSDFSTEEQIIEVNKEQNTVVMGNLFGDLELNAFLGDENITIDGGFSEEVIFTPPALEFDEENKKWSWSPARAWNHKEEPESYLVEFAQQCYLQGDPKASFTFNVYDQGNADQLSSDAITEANICGNDTDSTLIDWVPAQVIEGITEYVIESDLAGLISSAPDENGKISFYIHPSIAAEKRFVTIRIRYKLSGDEDFRLPIEQYLSVASPIEINISDSETGGFLEDSYCYSEDSEVDLIVIANGIDEELTYYSRIKDDGEYNQLGLVSKLFFREPGAGDIDDTQYTSANYLAPNNTYDLRVAYKTKFNCASIFDTEIEVHDLPNPFGDRTIQNCIGNDREGIIAPIDLTPLSEDSIQNYSLVWSVDDIVRGTTWSYDSKISDGVASENTFDINVLNIETGCIGPKSEVTVYVGELPTANFDYTITNDQKLWVEDKASSTGQNEQDQIVKWDWTVLNEQNDQLTRDRKVSGYDTINVSSTGVDTLQLVVTTNLGCKDTIKQLVTIPAYADQSGDSYSTNFNGEHGWVATTQNENTSSKNDPKNSTWTLKEYNGVTTAWHASGNNESSWVESPLIDISQWSSPVLSMDVCYDTPDLEGLVIQYRLVGETPEQNSDWQIVGSTETGSISYNSSGISARPGDDIIGWAGKSESVSDNWIMPAFELSEARIAARSAAQTAGRSLDSDLYVQFRVAYATLDIVDGDQRVGVAFDNLSVYNKERKVFIEHYTNLKYPRFDEERKKVNAFVKERYDTEDPDIVYVQFHTPNGGPDTLNMMYTGERNSHHALREAPRRGLTFINQVQHEMGTFETDAVDLYGRETVQAPAFDLELSFDRENYQPGDYLQVSASAIRNSVPRITLDTAAKDLLNILQVAVVEKEIEYNGETHHNVLVELLPYFGKYNKWADWGRELGESIVIESEGWQIPVDAEPNRFALVAWIEKTRVNPYSSFNGIHMSREIFQAKQVDIDIPLFTSTPITSVKKLSSQGIKYYPIPIRDELHIELAEVTSPHTRWSVMTLTGQTVLKGNWQVSSQSQTIDMQALDRGIYLLQIEGYDKPIRISKN